MMFCVTFEPSYCPNENFPQKFCLGQCFSVHSHLISCTISEKTNDLILRKSKKSPFLGPFYANLGKREFSRKICLGQFLEFIII